MCPLVHGGSKSPRAAQPPNPNAEKFGKPPSTESHQTNHQSSSFAPTAMLKTCQSHAHSRWIWPLMQTWRRWITTEAAASEQIKKKQHDHHHQPSTWKGNRIWHSRYSRDGVSISKKYNGLFMLLCQLRGYDTEFAQVKQLLEESKFEKALAVWTKVFNQLTLPDRPPTKRVRSFDIGKHSHSIQRPDYLHLPVEGYSHGGQSINQNLLDCLVLVASDPVSVNYTATDDDFWAILSKSDLAVEILPELVRQLCIKGRVQTAHELLHVLEKHLTTRASSSSSPSPSSSSSSASRHSYCDALVNTVNVLLYYYSKNLKSNWHHMIDLLENLNLQDGNLVLVDNVTMQWYELPQEALAPMFRTLLAKKVDLSDEIYGPFLKAFFQNTDVGKELLSRTDEAMQQVGDKGDSEKACSPAFHLNFYKYLIQRLSREKQSDKTAWLLENVWLKKSKKTDWGLLLYRAMEIDGINTAGTVYEYMTSKNISPTRNILLVLMRGFRINALENKCFEVVDIAKQTGEEGQGKLDFRMCTELLTLIADRYDPSVVLNYYLQMFPQGAELASKLGLTEYIETRGIHHEDVSGPRLILGAKDIAVHNERHNHEALSVVYKAVLNSIEDSDVLLGLYSNYVSHYESLGTKRVASMRVIDLFVHNLCTRFRSRTAVDAAHDLLVDASQRLRFKFKSDSKYRSHSLSTLSYYHCLDIKPFADGARVFPAVVDRAEELIKLAQHYDHLLLDRRVYEPMINYYLRIQDKTRAWELKDHAERMGAVITDSRITGHDYFR